MRIEVGELLVADQHHNDVGLLDGLSGCQVRAGSDDLADLVARSRRGVGPDERRLRRTDFDARGFDTERRRD